MKEKRLYGIKVGKELVAESDGLVAISSFRLLERSTSKCKSTERRKFKPKRCIRRSK